MKKNILLFVVILVIIAAMLAVASPAFAKASCAYNPQHGWHIVGGGQSNDHWFNTEEECLASLVTPTATTPVATTTTPDPTEEATKTPDPTETPVVTETPDPTEEITETPTVVKVDVSITKARGNSCAVAWNMIQTRKFRDVGYRYFDNPEHAWCQDWLMAKYGINYNHYKETHP